MNIEIQRRNDETEMEALARSELDPAAGNAGIVRTFSASSGDDLTALHGAISKSSAAASSGDLSEPESILMSQAHSLNAIFIALAHRAAANMGEHLQATETYLRLALRAQGQCRATLETLAEIKNPRSVTITRQANIAGQQIVNNGTLHAGGCGNQKTENELLGGIYHERLDIGAAQAASGTYQDVATLEAIDGGENSRREGTISRK